MHRSERVSDLLGQARDCLAQALDVLTDCLATPAELKELMLETREISRFSELTTVTLVKQLVEGEGLNPDNRNSFNNFLHAGRFTRSELKSAVKLSDDLFERPAGLSNSEPRPARMPETARGFGKGAFGLASAMEISRVLDQIPEGTPEESVAHVERLMAQFAETLAPDDLRKAGLKILQGLNAENPPSDADRQRRRSVKVSPQRADLMSTLTGTITPELKSLLDRLFADYAGPGDLLPAGEKESDTRTADQRRHDALVAALKTALHRTGGMPPTRGCSTVVATMTLEQLRRAAGVVSTDVGTLLPIPDLIRLGADSNAFLAILEDGTGNLIELGRTKRAADVYAYLGLFSSQGGDMTPGSDLPAALCEVHHWKAWKLGGRSTAGNMGLVGHRTHRNIDDHQQDPGKYWTICTETGHLLFKPPDSLDPERRPRANFNPATWFNPGCMIRYGLFRPDKDPPFATSACSQCGQASE